MPKHVMLDLETFGTKHGCVVRSVGAVVFELDRPWLGEEFYMNIDHQSCLDVGLHVDPNTEKWWSEREQAAQDAIMVDPKPLLHAVEEFQRFWHRNGLECVWAQGANFDPGIWEAASQAIGKSAPWKFYNVRDTRTVYDIAGFNVYRIKRDGTYHNALDDAKHQVKLVQMSLASR